MQQDLILRPLQQQQLALTPQIVQAIRVLQLSAADLEHEIEELLARNPFLERTEVASAWVATAPAADERVAAERLESPAADADDPTDNAEYANPEFGAPPGPDAERDPSGILAAQPTLRDNLIEQLAGSRLASCERLLVEIIVDALDDDGYLRQSVEELLPIVPPEIDAAPEDVEVAVRFVQSLDPAGIAARSVAECLAIQLRRLPAKNPGRAIALRIVREHLDLLALHDSAGLAKRLGCDDAAIRRANVLIRSLDPRPGSRFGAVSARYVVPDVLVRKVGGKWISSINARALPGIRVHRMYADALRRRRDGNSALTQHLHEARWFMRNVRQRFETIQRVTQAIVDRQQLFFERGELAMRPLLLRDIADEVGLHVSTISRVTSNKYMDTPAGLIEMKKFFSSAVTSKESGASCSSTAIRALIREVVAIENPHAPVSDVQITRILTSRGIAVARRTVAKYRDALRIPPVEARRLAVVGGDSRHPGSARSATT
ncbi:MAG: RNA polymerase factor sigma-54 [Burkholderiales bacterium]